MAKWKRIRCSGCGGHGLVSDYHGDDFYGPKECGQCSGKGFNWISDKDCIVEYPGGQFRGSLPGGFKDKRVVGSREE